MTKVLSALEFVREKAKLHSDMKYSKGEGVNNFV